MGNDGRVHADDELYSLLIPLSHARLILPRACVAEVVRHTTPEPLADAPPWLKGMIQWNGRSVPVLSFEELAGLEPAPPGGRTRVVILNAITGQPGVGCFGLYTEGFPQLVRINRRVLEIDPGQSWPESGPVICQAKMINDHPLIPDLEVIESMLQAALDRPAMPLS